MIGNRVWSVWIVLSDTPERLRPMCPESTILSVAAPRCPAADWTQGTEDERSRRTFPDRPACLTAQGQDDRSARACVRLAKLDRALESALYYGLRAVRSAAGCRSQRAPGGRLPCADSRSEEAQGSSAERVRPNVSTSTQDLAAIWPVSSVRAGLF